MNTLGGEVDDPHPLNFPATNPWASMVFSSGLLTWRSGGVRWCFRCAFGWRRDAVVPSHLVCTGSGGDLALVHTSGGVACIFPQELIVFPSIVFRLELS